MACGKITNENSFFNKMVDELVEFAEFDQELKEGIAWLDKNEKYGINLTFYEKVYYVLYKHDSIQKAKDWMLTKNETKTNQET